MSSGSIAVDKLWRDAQVAILFGKASRKAFAANDSGRYWRLSGARQLAEGEAGFDPLDPARIKSASSGDLRNLLHIGNIPRGLRVTFIARCAQRDEQIHHRVDRLTIGVGLLHKLVVCSVSLRS